MQTQYESQRFVCFMQDDSCSFMLTRSPSSLSFLLCTVCWCYINLYWSRAHSSKRNFLLPWCVLHHMYSHDWVIYRRVMTSIIDDMLICLCMNKVIWEQMGSLEKHRNGPFDVYLMRLYSFNLTRYRATPHRKK